MSAKDCDERSAAAKKRRRSSTALSCAECRRLKLRCSRNFPCSNCVKKGCGAICPEGSLTTGKGNRFVLANTETLHEKIGDLSARVRQLEDALAESHSAITHERHPLLSDDLLAIKRPLEREKMEPSISSTAEDEADDTADAMGSLSISSTGRSSFYGRTANSWYLLQNEIIGDGDSGFEETSSECIFDPPWMSHAFPFSNASKVRDQVNNALLNALPPANQAMKIIRIYFQTASWLFIPISEADFQANVFRPIYDPDLSANGEPVSAHVMAVLYTILAVGTLMDTEILPNSRDAKQYYELAKAALAMNPVLEEQTVFSVQALAVMCHYMCLADIHIPQWVLLGILSKLAFSIGLHRDGGKWQLSPEETQQRRNLMWELYSFDLWQSLAYGRPPSFNLLHIDTLPAYAETRTSNGEVEMSFHAWKHKFIIQCLAVVHEQAFSARPPTYKTIQMLDKKIRDFYIPPSLQIPGFGGSSKATTEVERPSLVLTMQRGLAFTLREITLFYMHRGFFARAMQECPDDPLGSKYAASVLASYTSACSYVGLIESLYSQYPALMERTWHLFTHVFSCAIVLGSIATKKRMALAPSALSHLESACNLFLSVQHNPKAKKIIPIIIKLRDRASMVDSDSSSPVTSINPSKTDNGEDLLSVGAANVPAHLLSKDLSSPSSSSSSTCVDSFPTSSPHAPACAAAYPPSPLSALQPISATGTTASEVPPVLDTSSVTWSYAPVTQPQPQQQQPPHSIHNNGYISSHHHQYDTMPHQHHHHPHHQATYQAHYSPSSHIYSDTQAQPHSLPQHDIHGVHLSTPHVQRNSSTLEYPQGAQAVYQHPYVDAYLHQTC